MVLCDCQIELGRFILSFFFVRHLATSNDNISAQAQREVVFKSPQGAHREGRWYGESIAGKKDKTSLTLTRLELVPFPYQKTNK